MLSLSDNNQAGVVEALKYCLMLIFLITNKWHVRYVSLNLS